MKTTLEGVVMDCASHPKGGWSAEVHFDHKIPVGTRLTIAPQQAAPAVDFLNRVIDLCLTHGPSPSRIEHFSEHDKWIADLWRETELMIAAQKGGA